MATVQLNTPIPTILTSNKHSLQTDPNLRILSLTDHCTHINHLKQLHAQMLRTGLFFDPFAASKLFTASLSPPISSLDYARKVFDQIPQPNLYTWNTLIRAFASNSQPLNSLHVFLDLISDSPYCPNNFTFPFVIKAASAIGFLPLGQAIHGMVIKGSLDKDLFVRNSLLHFYASCGRLDMASVVFDKMDEKDVVSWNSIISGCAQGGSAGKAVELFERMVREEENFRPDNVTLVAVLSACTKTIDVEFGRRVCKYIELNEVEVNLKVQNAMLDFYVKTGSVEEAGRLFDKMEEKDVISWTTRIYGYAKIGDFDSARNVLGAMPSREIAAWNVLISAYEQNGEPKKALAIFRELQLNRTVKPDEVTFVSALSACAQLGAIDLGDWIYCYLKENRIKLNCHLTTSLIDMYSKCGFIEKALEVFHSAERRDVFVWSSMIAGLAMHGCGRAAIDMFSQMIEAKITPNSVTFTNLLSACSHAGLVDEGRIVFKQMEPVYGVTSGAKHYACMVDILGRAGLLDEAVDFIEKMPISPSTSVWTALLGACRIHGNLEIAEQAYDRLLEIDPTNDGAFVLLSNIYAKTGKWDRVSGLRQHMKHSGIKKEPGCSSIEANGIINEFFVGDNSHPLSNEIYLKLDEIVAKIKADGYVPNKSHVLQCVEEEDMQEQALNLHSEKLAIAFGLITLDKSQPIRVMKNLRICGDCHSVAKLISKLYGRDIILRDRYRFHHFSGGRCSCMDYW